MKGNYQKKIIIVMSLFLLGLAGCAKSDPELNMKFSPYESGGSYCRANSEYLDYYNQRFRELSVETDLIDMSLHWFIEEYDKVYMGKSDYFYLKDINSDGRYSDLIEVYNANQDTLYYLKPLCDCYQLMDHYQYIPPNESELENVKEKILYALEYYINGKDARVMLEE